MTQDEIILQSEIERCGEARFYPTSSSMRPTINPRKDVCIIGPLPKKYLKLANKIDDITKFTVGWLNSINGAKMKI